MKLLLKFSVFAIIFIKSNLCSEKTVFRAVVESCPGCSLNRLIEVKKFIFEDLPNYENVDFKKINGAPPELVLLDEADEEIERIPLKTLNRQECNELLQNKGFKLKSTNIIKARVESCPSCSLNRLPEVKKFIYEDLPKYENVEFKKIHGAPPELVILNNNDEEVERLPLKELNREECNNLLLNKGLKLKPKTTDEL